jgi:hypothetical protein
MAGMAVLDGIKKQFNELRSQQSGFVASPQKSHALRIDAPIAG